MDGDVKIAWNVNHGAFSLTPDGLDLATDAGLQTAVIISLFTDRRASDTDELPATETDRRGWWGNDFEAAGDEVGSKLWLLKREKQMPSVVRRAEGYARDALRWLIADNVAKNVSVRGSIPRQGWLLLEINIVRIDGRAVDYRYDYNYQAQTGRT